MYIVHTSSSMETLFTHCSIFKVNDDGVVDIGNRQTMRCVICHSATISANLLAMCT